MQGCKADMSKKDCDTLEIFGRLVESLESTSSVPDLVHVLSCQCHAEKGTWASRRCLRMHHSQG